MRHEFGDTVHSIPLSIIWTKTKLLNLIQTFLNMDIMNIIFLRTNK